MPSEKKHGDCTTSSGIIVQKNNNADYTQTRGLGRKTGTSGKKSSQTIRASAILASTRSYFTHRQETNGITQSQEPKSNQDHCIKHTCGCGYPPASRESRNQDKHVIESHSFRELLPEL